MTIQSVVRVVLVALAGVATAAACSSTVDPDTVASDGSVADVVTPGVDGALVDGSSVDASSDAARDALGDVVTADAPGVDAAVAVPSAPSSLVAAAVPIVTSVSTLSGSGVIGFLDGPPGTAQFSTITGICVDAANNVYVADSGNDRIRKITPAGVVSTFAGGTRGYLDGVGTAARFYDPYGLAVDAAGNVFVSERFNHRIRKITAAGVVTTVAGSGEIGEVDATGVAASFNHPQGLAVAASGDLLVVDTDNQRIRRVTQAGVVTTLAGSGLASYADGTGPAASFFFPYNVALDVDGNAYFGDQYNHRIRKMTPTNVVTTIAGSGAEAFADGVGAAASFNYPSGVALDASRNVYVADYLNSRIRRVSPTGVVTTFAGGDEPEYIDGATPAARFNFAVALTVAADGTFYVADLGNVRVRKIVSTGIGRLAVSWAAPSSSGGAPITKYVAKAAAPGMPTATCTTTGATSCTFERLTSSVAYAITVVATNAGGDGPASAVGTGTPN